MYIVVVKQSYMFRKNESYRQGSLFSVKSQLSRRQRKLWDNSEEQTFFNEVFQKIDEKSFSVLYSNKKSRPNAPVNQMVGALILKHLKNWTYKDMFNNLNFNILTRHSIGVSEIGEDVFSEASIFNFQNRVIEYYDETNIDLIDNVFKAITKSQIKQFGVDTKIQRGDSFLIGSNIKDYTRLELLIVVLLRLIKILPDEDKSQLVDVLKPYVQTTSSSYIFNVKKEDLPNEMTKIAIVYNLIDLQIEGYEEQEAYRHFKRIIKEHFDFTVQEELKVNPSNELNSSILMSPDDEDATYRKKRKVDSKGYSGHISETADPENDLNLITDVHVVPNNTDDAEILASRQSEMLERTPDLNEYFADGAYGNKAVDLFNKENDITQYQSNIRGKKSKMGFKIFKKGEEVYASCAGKQEVKAINTKGGRLCFVFDYTKCMECKLNSICTFRKSGGKTKPKIRSRYANKEDVLAHQRFRNIDNLPIKKKRIRANVEASVKEMQRGMKNSKVRIRGRIRVSMYMIFTAIAVNLTRINKKMTNLFEYYFPHASQVAM